ncbi:MAG: response regulator [Labilithrix sp.]|nr:response regulator [Labilithrix sp.]
MSRGRILVIEGDEWMGPLLARELKEKSFEVDVCAEAREGFQKACETMPDCVVCSVDLPDIDGFWVARRMRTEGGTVAKTPIVLLGDLADKEARIQGLQVGADVVLERPVTNAEIVAQVEALIAMARRMSRSATDAPDEQAPSLAAAFRGDLSTFPLASVLMMLEMERRTGTLEVLAGSGQRALLTLTSGLFGNTEVNDNPRPALDVLREVLSWRTGRFAFRPRDVGSMPPPRGSVGALVLEAMRLEDERNAAS